jgi:GT2 family glycosyltransferase
MIDVVLITSGRRPELLAQSLDSLIGNAANGFPYSLTVVFDGSGPLPIARIGTLIIHAESQGASASRNVGAGSITQYRRQKYVMFCDDDIYACPKWDESLLGLARDVADHHSGDFEKGTIISGHSHPFNHAELTHIYGTNFGIPLVISSVHMLMPWELWDDVGYFQEPGGPGGSEDYDYCMRAKAKGYGFAVTEPQCIIHCGLTSTSGKPIVGYSQMVAQNNRLVEQYGLQGKVQWQ